MQSGLIYPEVGQSTDAINFFFKLSTGMFFYFSFLNAPRAKLNLRSQLLIFDLFEERVSFFCTVMTCHKESFHARVRFHLQAAFSVSACSFQK